MQTSTMTFHALNTAILQEWRRQLNIQAPFFPVPVTLANCLAGRDVGGLVGNSTTSDTCIQPLEFDAEYNGSCQPIFVTSDFIGERRKRKRGRSSGRARKSAGSFSQPGTGDTQYEDGAGIIKEHSFNIEFLDNLKMKLAQLEQGSSYSQVDWKNEFDALMRLPVVQMEGLLHDLYLSKLSEENLAGLCKHICEAEDVVYQNCVALLQSTLLAKCSMHASCTRADRSPIANSYYFDPERVQSERQGCGGWFIVAPYP
ncbi:hypothetical protein BC937DRAFT_89575 [Endogone sp. FLAS-F59071]|nr:hypothetical protein BC937DRAFT_89575 [Endogone sp. FLAS-F59071]|eukprot:RUS23266.1 hypothetical protein BC937DRAFT_89575 [Endogone sp. FLAS-F59071]